MSYFYKKSVKTYIYIYNIYVCIYISIRKYTLGDVVSCAKNDYTWIIAIVTGARFVIDDAGSVGIISVSETFRRVRLVR